MAAYAALVSLMNAITIEQSIARHPHDRISFDGRLIEDLQERVNFLVEFLEEGWKGTEDLDGRIADAAQGAEDAIESCVVGQFLAGCRSPAGQKWSVLFCQDLGRIVQEMDSIKNEAMRIREMSGIKDMHGGSSIPASSSSVPLGERNEMVGFDDEKIQIMEELTGHQSSRLVISIVGMGGIGKTMLARNIFDDKLIVQHFDIRAWVTVSQEYNMKEIFMKALFSHGPEGYIEKKFEEFIEKLSQKNEEALEELVHKNLIRRRYLIVMDDIWNIDVCDKIKRFFPDNNQGSRVIVTTRLLGVANQIGTTSYKMKLLDENSCWGLLREIVFGHESCPTELEAIGKVIVKSCKGLSLALVVIGGLLAKSDMTLEYWEHVAENVSSTLYLDGDEERYLNVLYLSYKHLSIHLKPCFLYMGVFKEDQEIRVSELTKLWVAEGFLKLIKGKIMEDVAEQYLEDLIERHLIMASDWGSCGKIKSCHMHDSLRDLCMREAQKKKFFCVVNAHNLNLPQGMRRQQRIVLNKSTSSKIEHYPEVIQSLQLALFACSLICNFEEELPSPTFLLLRVLNVVDKYVYKENDGADKYHLDDIFNLVNLRYLAFKPCWSLDVFNTFSMYHLRNVQTVVVSGPWTWYAPFDIWKMPQLRHIKFKSIYLPEPDFVDDIVLQNLQTLKNTENFICCDKIVQKIPNIRKLRIRYNGIMKGQFMKWSRYCSCNLVHLEKLESLALYFPRYNPQVWTSMGRYDDDWLVTQS